MPLCNAQQGPFTVVVVMAAQPSRSELVRGTLGDHRDNGGGCDKDINIVVLDGKVTRPSRWLLRLLLGKVNATVDEQLARAGRNAGDDTAERIPPQGSCSPAYL